MAKMSESLQARYDTTPFFGGNAPYVEILYEQFLQDPGSVSAAWRDYFTALRAGSREVPRGPVEAELLAHANVRRTAAPAGGDGGLSPEAADKQAAVIRLIGGFRGRGHLHAKLDPLGLALLPEVADLTLEFHGLNPSDMDTVFSTVSLGGPDRRALRDILEMLQRV